MARYVIDFYVNPVVFEVDGDLDAAETYARAMLEEFFKQAVNKTFQNLPFIDFEIDELD